MEVSMSGRKFGFPGSVIRELEECNALLDDVPALHQRMDTEGYLHVRELIPRATVLAARRVILERLHAQGVLKPDAPLMDGIVNPDVSDEDRAARHSPAIAEILRHRDVRAVLESAEIRGFFDRYFGEPTLVLDLKIIRAHTRGWSTGIHYDVVYMGRGTRRLSTCWIPLGDIPLEQGPLALSAGSNSLPGFSRLRETYGAYDVDETIMRGAQGSFPGWFSLDMGEVAEQFGGQWRTANYRAGDILAFTIHTMHCGLDNSTDRYRLSADVRYQPHAEPVDERWMGEHAPGNTAAHQLHRNEVEAQTTLEAARREWGV